MPKYSKLFHLPTTSPHSSLTEHKCWTITGEWEVIRWNMLLKTPKQQENPNQYMNPHPFFLLFFLLYRKLPLGCLLWPSQVGVCPCIPIQNNSHTLWNIWFNYNWPSNYIGLNCMGQLTHKFPSVPLLSSIDCIWLIQEVQLTWRVQVCSVQSSTGSWEGIHLYLELTCYMWIFQCAGGPCL